MDVISYALSKKYTDEKIIEQKLKVATVEKELNDYKNTLAQVNINQEPRQSASGYGIVSLPKNAANGNVSVSVEGETLTNLVDNGIDNSNWLGGGLVSKNGITISAKSGNSYVGGVKLKPNTKYTIILDVISKEGNADIRMSNNFTGGHWVIASNIGKTKKTFTTKSDLTSTTLILFCSNVAEGNIKFNNVMILEGDYTDRPVNYIEGTKSSISAMRITSENKDKTEKSQAYVIAKDKDNKIVNLRSLPNGVADKIDLDEGILLKKINKLILKDGDIFDFRTATNRNSIFIRKPNDSIGIGNVKTKWVTIDGFSECTIEGALPDEESSVDKFTTANILDIIRIGMPKSIDTLEKAKEYISGRKLTYQLAEPEIIPIQVSGNLVSYPSGTVYFEKAQPDASVYNNKITIFEQELNIDYIDKLYKIDYQTGVKTEIDASKAVIAEDKKSFTHPDLVNGDMVFFEYFYRNETTEGNATVEFYDSRYTIKDKSTDKYYQWDIEVDNGVPSIKLKEV